METKVFSGYCDIAQINRKLTVFAERIDLCVSSTECRPSTLYTVVGLNCSIKNCKYKEQCQKYYCKKTDF